jgi:hypothetical protein
MRSSKLTVRPWANDALRDAEALGLLSDSSSVDLSVRVPRRLVEAAKEQTGVRSNRELILIALSALASRDDFGEQLLKRKGAIDPSQELLEF